MPLLEVRHLSVHYGLIRAVRDVSFEVGEGQIVALIGANGTGKTTVMHAVNGLLPKAAGQVIFAGEDITATPAQKLVGMGLAQVPEGRRIFQELTVYDNLRLGYYCRRDARHFEEKLEEMYASFPILKERRRQIAGTLSGGEQQMLAMSRALMSDPRLLLLDEPGMGLSPRYVSEVFDIIRRVNEKGTTVLLVEQNAKMALSIADQAYVMETGNLTIRGTGAALMNDPAIRRSYLGG